MSIVTFQGDPIAPGFSVGPLYVLKGEAWITPPTIETDDTTLEIDRFQRQIHVLEREIEEAIDRLESESFRAEAEIMRTHLMILRDPELHRQVLELIQDARHRAETAVEQVLEGMSSMLASAEDPLLAERATDLRDLAMRLKAGLSERRVFDTVTSGNSLRGVIVALPELMPSLVLEAWELGVAGFVVEYGTTVAHAAILAKSFGIPVVRVTRLESVTGYAGRNVLVWGGGEILVEPSEAELEAREPSEKVIPIQHVAGAPKMRVWLSIVDPEQLEAVDWTGIEGVGLYRSEALFMRHRHDFPSEHEQFVVYRRLFELAGQRPVVFRTVDLGADKPVDHMHFGPQDNPCLGMRAHRLFRFHQEILITQVRAVLRAACGDHQLRLMFPMLESIDQLRFVQGLVSKAIQSLIEEEKPYQDHFLQGVLVETPSAAWSFKRLLGEVDFASIGTNDLVQYLFAVERNTANVADLYQPEHPVVLEVIHHLVQQAADACKQLSICGEIAADSSMLPVLTGLGIRDLSLAPTAVAPILRQLAVLDESACRQLAEQCLQVDTLEGVNALLGRQQTQETVSEPMGQDEAIDPICGMLVKTADTPYALDVGEVTHFFCSRSCLNRFINDCKVAGGG